MRERAGEKSPPRGQRQRPSLANISKHTSNPPPALALALHERIELLALHLCACRVHCAAPPCTQVSAVRVQQRARVH